MQNNIKNIFRRVLLCIGANIQIGTLKNLHVFICDRFSIPSKNTFIEETKTVSTENKEGKNREHSALFLSVSCA